MSMTTVLAKPTLALVVGSCCAAAAAADVDSMPSGPALGTPAGAQAVMAAYHPDRVTAPRFSAGLDSAAGNDERSPSRETWDRVTRPAGEGLGRRNLLFSLRMKLGDRSQVVFDQIIARSRSAPDERLNADSDRPFGIALEFKAANASQMAGLRQGTLLKMNLSNSSSLGLRTRKGKLVVMWRAQW